MAVTTPTTAPDGTGHAIVAPTPPVVPPVSPTRLRPRPPVRSPAGVAARRGRPRPRPADRDELDPGGRSERRVPPVLHHGVGGREAGRPHRRTPGARGRGAAGGPCRPADARTRRHPDRAVRAVRPGGRGPPQPDPRAGRVAVRVRARVGGPRPARVPPGLGRRRPPA